MTRDLNDLFIRAARGLFGNSWQTDTAKALQMSDRQVRRIAAGQARAQTGMLFDLWRLIHEHQAELDQIAEEIKRVGHQPSEPDPPSQSDTP